MKKIKLEFIVLGALSLVLVLYLVFNNATTKVNYNLPNIEKVKQDEVTRVVLESAAEGIINISKEGDSWLIQPQGYKVDETAMKDILSKGVELELTELISTAGYYNEYELDDGARIKVALYNGDKVLREFEVGKQANTYNHTFVKLPNDKNVYHAKGNMKLVYNKKLMELRDKKILKFDKDAVKKITITSEFDKKKAASLALVKTEKIQPSADPNTPQTSAPAAPEQPFEWKSPDGKAQDITKVNQILDNTYDLSCKEYAPENEDLSKPYFTISIEADKPYELKVFAPKPDGTYPAMSSLSKHVFYLQSWNGSALKESLESLLGIKFPTTTP